MPLLFFAFFFISWFRKINLIEFSKRHMMLIGNWAAKIKNISTNWRTIIRILKGSISSLSYCVLLQVVHISIMLKLGSNTEYTLNCWIWNLSTSVKSISVTSQRGKRVRTVWIGHGHKSEIKTTTTIGLKNINVYKKSYNGKTTLLP